MFEDFKCKCGNDKFQIYHSLNKMVCDKCKKGYKISDIKKDPLKIKHQRG